MTYIQYLFANAYKIKHPVMQKLTGFSAGKPWEAHGHGPNANHLAEFENIETASQIFLNVLHDLIRICHVVFPLECHKHGGT